MAAQNSPVNAVIAPPRSNMYGWQLYSQRACIMRPSFASYTSFSRELALRFDQFMKRFPLNDDMSWVEWVRFAKAEGANLVIVDDREELRRDGDPEPLHSCGHYHILRVE